MPHRTIPHHIETTEVRQRKTVITLDTVEIHEILQDWALRKVYADPRGTLDRVEVEFGVTPITVEGYDPDARITIIEDLPTPTDFAPPNIEEAVRLTRHGPPIAPREIPLATAWGHLPSCGCLECMRIAKTQPVPQDLIFEADEQEVLRVVGPVKHLGTTSPTSMLNVTDTSSRENVDAIERMKKEQPALLKARDINSRYTEIKTGIPRGLAIEDLMKRVNKLHDVLLHGKGNNIVLTPGEVDTVLEYINNGNQGKGSYTVPPYTEPMNLPMPEGASILSAARSGPVGVVGSAVELASWECIDGKWGRSF